MARIEDLPAQKTTFLSAEVLGLTLPYRDALIKLLDLLESGKLPWVSNTRRPKKDGFNISIGLSEGDCGTVGCFAGWAYILSGRVEPPMVRQTPEQMEAWGNLVTPPGWGNGADERYSLPHCITALRSYLETGHAAW